MTPKQEAFAQAYVETGNAAEAYRRAYNAENMAETTIWPNASRLLKNSKVEARILLLKQHHAKRHDMTIDDITQMLKEDRQMARDIQQPSAAISAAMGMAKLHGLIVEKQEHSGKEGGPAIELIVTSRTKTAAKSA